MMDMNQLLGVGEQKTQDNFFKTVKMQFDGSNKNLDMITDLHPEQIINLARIAVFNSWSDNKVKAVDIFTKRFMRMMVSANRQGRKEFFDTWKAAGQEHAKMGLMSSLFSRRDQPPQI